MAIAARAGCCAADTPSGLKGPIYSLEKMYGHYYAGSTTELDCGCDWAVAVADSREEVLYMSVLVIGGDSLGNIERNLYSLGVTQLKHISGRRASQKNKVKVPKHTDLILVLTDYVNHNTSQTVRNIARMHSIPLVYAKRSWSSVEKKLVSSRAFSCLINL